jgi:hypothetical protein
MPTGAPTRPFDGDFRAVSVAQKGLTNKPHRPEPSPGEPLDWPTEIGRSLPQPVATSGLEAAELPEVARTDCDFSRGALSRERSTTAVVTQANAKASSVCCPRERDVAVEGRSHLRIVTCAADAN